MEFQSYRCDECGTVKREANHWFRATHLPSRFVIVPWGTPLFRIPDPAATEQHLCGMGCAIKAMSKAMELQAPVNFKAESEANA